MMLSRAVSYLLRDSPFFGQKNTPVRKEKHRGEKERKKKLK